VAATLEVDIFSSDTRLFEELNVIHFLVSDQNRLFQMEVNYHNNFFRCAWLEEAVLDVGETDINFLAFASNKTYTILLDFKVSYSLFTCQIRSNDKALESFFALRARSHDKFFQFSFSVELFNFRSSLLVLLNLLKLFDFLRSHRKSVVRTSLSRFKRHLVDHQVFGVRQGRELHLGCSA